MSSFLQRLFKRAGASASTDESFAARFHRFTLFLGAYLDAYGEILRFEERLADELPVAMSFLRLSTTKLAISTMQCILQLGRLAGGSFERMNEPFAALRQRVQAILNEGLHPVEGPLVVSCAEFGEAHAAIIPPTLAGLLAVKQAHPECMPRGFVLTGAAWWSYFNNQDLLDEIERLILISQEDPSSYGEAAATIRERISSSFPLPDALANAVREMLDREFPELGVPGYSLLLRGIPLKIEHSALVMPEQLLHTPLEPQTVLDALQASLVMTYRPRAMLYRLKRGIRDRAMPLAVSLSLLPHAHARGSAHRALTGKDDDSLFLHIRRGFNTPESWPLQCAMEGAQLPASVQAQVEHCCRAALDCLADAPVPGKRHEIFWAAGEQGECFLLGVNDLPDPPRCSELAGPSATRPSPDAPALPVFPVFQGGRVNYPGVLRGRVKLVRNYVDAVGFSIGDILVLQRTSPRWSFLLDFASAAIAGDGTGNGVFARTARRYGRPSVLRQPEAFAALSDGQEILLVARGDEEVRIHLLPSGGGEDAKESAACREAGEPAKDCPDTTRQSAGVPGAAHPLPVACIEAPTWLPSSDIAVMTRELVPWIAPLTLPDSDHADFRAENCKSFHDFLVYCHVHAVQEMYRAGTSAKTAQAPAKQLVCDVPKQFWIINLDDGFYGDVKGPTVRLEEIASLPMRCLWEGFADKAWEGPPQLNAGGFLSVLFEATANPNLDPASQSTQYTEKNSFLIARRFCSMRCRFGFHFLSLDCLLGERERERFVIFQFKGGAANLARRVRRVEFVGELLARYNFATERVEDTLTARLEQKSEDEFCSALRVLGYLVMHTRQLDMIMSDEQALAAYRARMRDDMDRLAAREPLRLP